jgi:hypothetical protein
MPDTDSPDYEKKKESFFNGFYSKSAKARRGVDSAYTKGTNLPRLPIDCFVDDKRTTIGETDMYEPEDPTPGEPPEDPIEFTENTIRECKEEIMGHNGECEEGTEGLDPGRWYKQPIYCEIPTTKVMGLERM